MFSFTKTDIQRIAISAVGALFLSAMSVVAAAAPAGSAAHAPARIA